MLQPPKHECFLVMFIKYYVFCWCINAFLERHGCISRTWHSEELWFQSLICFMFQKLSKHGGGLSHFLPFKKPSVLSQNKLHIKWQNQLLHYWFVAQIVFSQYVLFVVIAVLRSVSWRPWWSTCRKFWKKTWAVSMSTYI